MSRADEQQRRTYYEALDALTRVFKLSYTVRQEVIPASRYQPSRHLWLQTSEVEFGVIDRVTRLLRKLDVAAPFTEGLCCDHPSKLLRALTYTKKKVQDLVDLNTFYSVQVETERANMMNLELRILERDVFDLSQDVLKESIVSSTEVNFYMSFIFQGLVCGM